MKFLYGFLLVISLSTLYIFIKVDGSSCNELKSINMNLELKSQLWADLLHSIELKKLDGKVNFDVTYSLKRGNGFNIDWNKYGLDKRTVNVYFSVERGNGYSFSDVSNIIVGIGYRDSLSYVVKRTMLDDIRLSTYMDTYVTCER